MTKAEWNAYKKGAVDALDMVQEKAREWDEEAEKQELYRKIGEISEIVKGRMKVSE